MNAMKGTQSIAFSESPYLVSAGSVAGKKEGEGPLGKYFDIASEDDLFGEKTWELAEGTMQKLACKLALKNAGVQPEEVRYLFGGDLLRQGIATSMGAEELQIPVFGLFGACSTIFPIVTPLIRTRLFFFPTRKAPLPVTVQVEESGL